jgi:phosphatidyl-myo-inositol dimannoside synthase
MRPEVLLIANIFPPIVGGSATVYYNLSRHLCGRAAVVTARCSYHDGSELPGWQSADAQLQFPVVRLPLLRPVASPPRWGACCSAWRLISSDLPFRRRLLAEVIRVVDELHPRSICLGELFPLHWLGTRIRSLRRLPIIHYIHGEELRVGNNSRLFSWGALDALRRAEAVVAVSSYTRQLLLERGVAPARIHLVPNGIDPARFSPGPPDSELVRRLGLSGKRVLLSVGRLEEKKGHRTLIQAMPSILASQPNAVCLIAGDGALASELRRLASACGVAGSVIFAGSVPDSELPEYYRLADVFVLPNRTMPNGDTEGFGLVFLEASACGKPVVSGSDGGVIDAVIDGVTGLRVDGSSAQAVAAAVLRILQDNQLASDFGAAGREFALRSVWQHTARLFQETCHSTFDPATG